MKITILSGGSGNDSLIKGLKSFYKDADIKVIVNAYDNGKSTGVCRKITNTLGVSDIRKNHIRMYKAIAEIVNQKYVDFFEGRFDLNENPLKLSLQILEECDIERNWPDTIDKPYSFIERFFQTYESDRSEMGKEYNFNNFCVGNILYAQMYKELGYEKTNSIICKFLGIDDFVLLNSFDNRYLIALLDNGKWLYDEGEIVDLADNSVKILSIDCCTCVDNQYFEYSSDINLNSKAINAVLNCDLLVISTGTFWSSIFPTLQYGDFYKFINESNCKKVWAMNNEYDKDSYGVTSIDFINKMDELGLDLSKFTLLINSDACDDLKKSNNLVGKVVEYPMGNTNGKHDGLRYAKELLRIYYNLDTNYDKILFDFDDTLWARDYLKDIYLHKLSRECIKLINSSISERSMIVSGNNKDSIIPKLQSIYGLKLDSFNIPMWLMAHASKFNKSTICDTIKEFNIDRASHLIDDLIDVLNDPSKLIIITAGDLITNIRIKPLNNFERELLFKYINENILPKYKDTVAYKTGRSTIDIMEKDNSKVKVIERENLCNKKLLYIGDEVDMGNDRDIAKLCTNAISTSGVEETHMLINLLIEDLKFNDFWTYYSGRETK